MNHYVMGILSKDIKGADVTVCITAVDKWHTLSDPCKNNVGSNLLHQTS